MNANADRGAQAGESEPYVCDVAGCEQGFPTMNEVVAHERTHRDENADCPHCLHGCSECYSEVVSCPDCGGCGGRFDASFVEGGCRRCEGRGVLNPLCAACGGQGEVMHEHLYGSAYEQTEDQCAACAGTGLAPASGRSES